MMRYGSESLDLQIDSCVGLRIAHISGPQRTRIRIGSKSPVTDWNRTSKSETLQHTTIHTRIHKHKHIYMIIHTYIYTNMHVHTRTQIYSHVYIIPIMHPCIHYTYISHTMHTHACCHTMHINKHNTYYSQYTHYTPNERDGERKENLSWEKEELTLGDGCMDSMEAAVMLGGCKGIGVAGQGCGRC